MKRIIMMTISVIGGLIILAACENPNKKEQEIRDEAKEAGDEMERDVQELKQDVQQGVDETQAEAKETRQDVEKEITKLRRELKTAAGDAKTEIQKQLDAAEKKLENFRQDVNE